MQRTIFVVGTNVISKSKEENGKSIATQFLDSIINDAREIKKILEYITPMKDLTLEQLAIFNSPNAECHICDKIILPTDVKVR